MAELAVCLGILLGSEIELVCAVILLGVAALYWTSLGTAAFLHGFLFVVLTPVEH